LSHVVPKREAAVRLTLTTGEIRRGTVFLDFIDVIHRGAQTLLDKLNDDSEWFPIRSARGIEMLNRRRVILVEPNEGLDVDLVRKDSAAVFRREAVTVHLAGERTLAGRIAMDLPDEFSRVSDFLNFPMNFFALETEQGPVLVSKWHVVSLLPHERPPAAPDPDVADFRRGARA
jgi:hypothetical protein